MTIPTGTTGRQLAGILRWMLLAVLAAGVWAWWSPGYGGWGGLVVGTLAVWALWLPWRTHVGETRVPANPWHLAMLLPLLLLLGHYARGLLGREGPGGPALQGAVEASLITQLLLVSLGVLLVQTLLRPSLAMPAALFVLGGGMVAGGLMGLAWRNLAPAAESLALLGLAGAWMMAAVLWGAGRPPLPHRHVWARRLLSILPAVAAGAILWTHRCSVGPGLVFGGGALVLAAVGAGACRVRCGVAGAVMLLGGLVVWYAARASCPTWGDLPFSVLGQGERGLGEALLRFGGLEVLVRATGWLGAGALLGILAGGLVWAMRIEHRPGEPPRVLLSVLWAGGTATATGAVLAPGGLAIPALAAAAMLAWGAFPHVTGRTVRRYPGGIVLGLLLTLLLVLGAGRRVGLIYWIADEFQRSDNLLHAAGGFIVALAGAWVLGARRMWIGLAVIAAVALLGGLAEYIQARAVGWRSGEADDWAAHALGAALALLPYLLAMAARWYESPHAVDRRALR